MTGTVPQILSLRRVNKQSGTKLQIQFKNKKKQTQPKPPQLTCIRNTQEIFYILSKPKYQNC